MQILRDTVTVMLSICHMPLGNREGGRCVEAESGYRPDVLCKELRFTADCIFDVKSPFFVQRTEKGDFYGK